MDLQEYYLPLTSIPSTLGGQFTPHDLEQWVNHRRRYELQLVQDMATEQCKQKEFEDSDADGSSSLS
jgi:hypothetical protein